MALAGLAELNQIRDDLLIKFNDMLVHNNPSLE
jgi:hypothetical protein